MNGMSLHPYPKGVPTGWQISIPPFDMASHPLHITILYELNTRSVHTSKSNVIWTKNVINRNTSLFHSKSRWWWDIIQNQSCLAHAKCRKLQIQEFFHAYTRVRLTWLQSWQSPWHPILQNTHSRTRKSGYESKLNPQTSKSFQYQACLPISSS
jgi:hypothetical protein